MAERARRRLPGATRPVAPDPRRVRLGCGHQRDPSRAGRRRRADLPRAPRHPRQLVHDGRLLDGRPHVRRHDPRARRVLLGADPGRAAVLRRAVRTPGFRLLLGVRRRRDPSRRRDRARRDRCRGRVAPQPLLGSTPGPRRPGVRGVRPSGAICPHRRPLAARRLGPSPRHGLVLPRRLRDPSEHRQRPARPGGDEPRDARARHARRDRHGAGAPRLRVPGRRRRALDTPRVQRRNEADAHGRERDRRLHGDLPGTRHGPVSLRRHRRRSSGSTSTTP